MPANGDKKRLLIRGRPDHEELTILLGIGDVFECRGGFVGIQRYHLQVHRIAGLMTHVGQYIDEVLAEMLLPVVVAAGLLVGEDLSDGQVVQRDQFVPDAIHLDFGEILVPADSGEWSEALGGILGFMLRGRLRGNE